MKATIPYDSGVFSVIGLTVGECTKKGIFSAFFTNRVVYSSVWGAELHAG